MLKKFILFALGALLLSSTLGIAQVPGGGVGLSGNLTAGDCIKAANIPATIQDSGAPCGSGTGNVTGPASATSGNIATFNGATGKIIQDGGVATGTSGATVPLLNGANTWSGTQSFNSGVLAATSPTVTTSLLANFPILTPGGRLTLTTVTPVMTATVSAATTVYYTPYLNSVVAIYDGTNWNYQSFSEVSQLTTDATKSPAAVAASSVYDVFVWNDAGTIRATRGPAWTNTTTRSAGTALVRVNGVWLNNATITNGPAAQRGTYVGSIASNAGSTIDWIFGAIGANGTASVLNVWNYYNRVEVATGVGDSTDSWVYSTATWRAANASNTMRVTFLNGLNEDAPSVAFNGLLSSTNSSGFLGVALDATNTFTGTSGAPAFSINVSSGLATAKLLAGLGQHFFQAVEFGNTGVTFYGDAGSPTVVQNLLSFEHRM